MSSMSLADYRATCPKAQKVKKGRNKFNASKIKLDGMTFDSTKEYKRYIELKALQQRGEIKELQHHTKFELAPKTKLEGRNELNQHLDILPISLISRQQVNTLLKM